MDMGTAAQHLRSIQYVIRASKMTLESRKLTQTSFNDRDKKSIVAYDMMLTPQRHR